MTRLTTRFTNRDFSVVALSGELTQSERTNALQALRDGRARVCVATDVAARGIDLPNLELVIHADLPSNADTLLHRSGRTGRAGRKGVSALIVPPKLKTKANRLLGWAKLKAEWAEPPTAAEVVAQDQARLLADSAWSDPVPEDAQEFINELTTRFSAEQLAQAFVNLYHTRQSAPEELSDPGQPDDRKARSFGPSVWFSVSLGRDEGADPRMLLPMLCKKGGMSRDDIGAIRVQAKESYVEVLATRADALVAAAGSDRMLEPGIALTRLNAAPNLGAPSSRKPAGKGKRPDTRRPDGPRSEAKRFDSKRPDGQRPKGKRPDAAQKPPARTEKPRTTDQWSKVKPAPAPTDAPAPRKKSKSKPVWTTDARDTARKDRKARDTENRGDSAATSRAKPAGKGKPAPQKDGGAAKKRASDTSKRFVPPHKRGQQNAKGPNAKPRRKT